MRTINPYMSAARRSGDPAENAARVQKHNQRARNCITDEKKYRLHYGETAVGFCVVAHPMEVHAWNKNARAYYAHQITLGRDLLPVLEWREVGQDASSLVWRVKFAHNGSEKELLVSAHNKAEAKREAERMISVAAVIREIAQDDDIEGAIEARRAMDSEDNGPS